MSKSKQLSKQRIGTVINEISKNEDKVCWDVANRIKNELIKNNPGLNIEIKKNISIKECLQKLKEAYPNEEFEDLSNSIHGFEPDGGAIYVTDNNNNNKHYVYISEVKHQGTNDKRIAEGKPKQAKGNAIERFGKNIKLCEQLFASEKIFPVSCYCSGCDFKEEYIKDKLHALNNFKPLNSNRMNDGIKSTSIYTKDDSFTEDEMYNIGIEMAEKQIKYYKDKKVI